MALIEMTLECSPYIPGPPKGPEACWKMATASDEITVKSWLDIWIRQAKENSKLGFEDHSAMQEWHKCRYQPVIVAGSGPSIKKNWQDLRGNGTTSLGRQDIKMISCLHNFGFMEDRDLMTSDDWYITLDAGEITLGEVTEGGKDHDEEWYWERTKDRTLVAVLWAYPELIRKWRGRVIWFVTPWANEAMGNAVKSMVDLTKVPTLQVGGCVLGAAMYFARAVLGCSVPIFIGADFSFDYSRKFHGWDSQYDSKFSGVLPWIDIFGNRVWTWSSYFGFKNWFDYIACGGAGHNAQLWINATEGGILGAYHEGNIQQIVQLDLKTALHVFNLSGLMPDQMTKSREGILHLLF